MEERRQVDIKKVDQDGEQILTQIREGVHPVDLFSLIKEFCEQNLEICSEMISKLDFKNCYYIFKKLEKVLIQILKKLQPYDCKFMPCGQIQLALLDHPDSPEKMDLKPFMLCPVELYKQELPEKNTEVYQLLDYIIKKAIICANNCGVIYMMRSKSQMALSHQFRGALARFQYLNDYNCVFQQAVLMINCAFCFKNMEKYEESGQLMNKGIIILEYIEKVLSDHGGIYNNFMEKGTVMLTLVEFLFNKSETTFEQITDNDKDRLTYLLSISYKYYGEILQKQRRNKEAEFCFDNSKTLYKKFKQSREKYMDQKNQKNNFQQMPQSKLVRNSKLTKNVLQQNFPKKNGIGNSQQNDDNFSHASFRTVNTVTTTNFNQLNSTKGDNLITKENIIFQKYVNVNEIRYKIIIIQIKEHNCIQILLYNKPKNFLKKIIVGFQALLDYSAVNKQEAFKDQEALNNFFKNIIRKLQLTDGELKLRDIEYFSNLEEYLKVDRLSKIGQQQIQQEADRKYNISKKY